jgi:hypothetical protein
VLVVEVLPNITNLREHMPELGKRGAKGARARSTVSSRTPLRGVDTSGGLTARSLEHAALEQGPSPVSDTLGHHRILRTSPLTEVPFVCCTDC